MYPQEVEEYLAKWPDTIEEILRDEGFQYTPEMVNNIIYNVIGPKSLERFLNDGDVVIKFPDEVEGGKFIIEIISYASLINLKSHGLVDTIEDENGQEIIFITEAGREVANQIKRNMNDTENTDQD